MKERTRRWLDQLLHTHDTPQRTAAAYAVGIFFGFSPMLGLHTVLGLAVAFAFNLNRVAVLLGIYSNLPWILPAYYSRNRPGGDPPVGCHPTCRGSPGVARPGVLGGFRQSVIR